MKPGGACAVAVALLLALVVPAEPSNAATVGGVPKIVLYTTSAIQEGQLVNATWTSFDGTFCLTQISDGSPVFPTHGAGWKPGSKVKIQLRKKQRPDQLTIRAWTKLQGERPAGAGELLSYALNSKMRKGRRIWVASFTPKFADQLYLRIRSNWVDTGSQCGGIQMGTWQFHLRAV